MILAQVSSTTADFSQVCLRQKIRNLQVIQNIAVRVLRTKKIIQVYDSSQILRKTMIRLDVGYLFLQNQRTSKVD